MQEGVEQMQEGVEQMRESIEQMQEGVPRKRISKVLVSILVLLAVLAAAVLIYCSIYYHSTDAAKEALQAGAESEGGSVSDAGSPGGSVNDAESPGDSVDGAEDAGSLTDGVTVSDIPEGWFFDGSGTENAMVFYPGAKVEADAYAPLLRRIAAAGTDCFLCRMPLNIALLDRDAAFDLAGQYDYPHWYLAGHSLGGATAAMLAESGIEQWEGLILLAAYATGPITGMDVLLIVGSEDHVLNREKYDEAVALGFYPSETSRQIVIEGGNHAQFGDYGPQRGDGEALISAEQQQAQTAEAITKLIEGDLRAENVYDPEEIL